MSHFFESDRGIVQRAMRFVRKRVITEPTRLWVSIVMALLIYLMYLVSPWKWLAIVWSVCVLHWMGEYQVVFQKQSKLV